MTAPPAFWGPLFPDYGHAGPCFWGPAFPDCFQDPTVVVAPDPATAATFALSWRDLKLRLSWPTSVFKTESGLESRSQRNDLPTITLSGNAYVAGPDVVARRGQYARLAASGKPFLLGLPYEAIPLTAPTAGAVCPVPSTAIVDWAVPGQRVIVTNDVTSVVGVIQSTAGGSVTLDVSPGLSTGYVMPAIAVLLDPEQPFTRFEKIGSLETWAISGRPVLWGYESGADRAAFAKLSDYTAGYLAGALALFWAPGTIGNGASLQLVANGFGAGNITIVGQAVTFHFQTLATTIQHLINALTSLGLIYLVGSIPSPFTTTLRAGVDEFTAPLAGGTNKNWGAMGNGAVVTTYAGCPVWDRPLELGDVDSMHAMTELLDLGGVVQNFQTATTPDWGRAVRFSRMDIREWQWFKAFLYAVRGRQVAFWLSSSRADLLPVSLAPGALKINKAYGDIDAWWARRKNLALVDIAGVTRYFTASAATDNGDGTLTLTVTSSDAAYTTGGVGAPIAAGGLAMLSWLDLCHFEDDNFAIAWDKGGQAFALATKARAVQR